MINEQNDTHEMQTLNSAPDNLSLDWEKTGGRFFTDNDNDNNNNSNLEAYVALFRCYAPIKVLSDYYPKGQECRHVVLSVYSSILHEARYPYYH